MELEWKRRNAWNEMSREQHREITAYAKDYMRFLSAAKTERECHDHALELATGRGFTSLDSQAENAVSAPGRGYYRSIRGRSLALIRIGRRPLAQGLRIVAAHTDAPRLDLKPVPVYEEGGMAWLDTHYYGGIKKYQWTACPLALHGVVYRENGEAVPIVVGERPADPVFTITDLLPHLGKDQAKKPLAEAIPGEGLNLLAAATPAPGEDESKNGGFKRRLLEELHRRYGIKEEDLSSAEIQVVPAGPARELGFDRSMILGYGQDDRVCAYAALRALLDMEAPPEYTAVVLLCDKEEIGSAGATGMAANFLETTVAELAETTGTGENTLASIHRCLELSKAISADVNVLHDPNFPEVSSPNNTAKINAGVVVCKYTGSRGKSGASEAPAEFAAFLRKLFNAAGVVWQTGELGKVDQGGGGTIAHFLARYGMEVIDCGPGLLSMHAPWEVCGKLDAAMARKAYAAFLA